MKTEYIHIRIEPELKKQFQETAELLRMNLTEFMIMSAIEKASKVQKDILEEEKQKFKETLKNKMEA